MNRETGQSRLGVVIGAAGLGAVTLTSALLFGGRSELSPGLTADPSKAPPSGAAPEIPGALVSPRAEAISTSSHRESVEIPPEPTAPTTQPVDPCSDTALARETFSKALALLQCSNPEVVALARDFLKTTQPDPEANLSEEMKTAILEAKTSAFDVALGDVRKELGDLSRRQPNAYIFNKDLPPEYAATRFEIHADEYGTPRPMIVTYTGSSGRGFTVPANDTGRRFALQMIMLNGEVEPEWYTLLLPSSQPR